MSKIAIVTDSTANLPAEWVRRYDIQVIPLKIHWREDSLLDGVDITSTEFLASLKTDAAIPTSSQPSMHDFLQTFDRLACHYEGIVVPLISSGLSGTVASAQAAAAECKKVPVEVVDTHSTSAGLALVVLAAAHAIEQGHDLHEITRLARNVARKLHGFFAIDTLEYLHRGGRIGTASRYLGSVLNIKPLLFLDEEGKIAPLERVRTRKQAVSRLLNIVEENAGTRPIHAAIAHADALEQAANLRTGLAQHTSCDDVPIIEFSPAIGMHVGPGTIGVAFYTE